MRTVSASGILPYSYRFLAAHGLQGFLAAHGLHGFIFLAAHGLQGFILAAHGLHGFIFLAASAVKANQTADAAVFCNRVGKPYRSFRTAFESARQKAGIVDFKFHDLRHTFASRLTMAGIDLPTVQELMGHKGISMTLRYTHLSSDHKQRAVSALEQFEEKSHQLSQHDIETKP